MCFDKTLRPLKLFQKVYLILTFRCLEVIDRLDNADDTHIVSSFGLYTIGVSSIVLSLRVPL